MLKTSNVGFFLKRGDRGKTEQRKDNIAEGLKSLTTTESAEMG